MVSTHAGTSPVPARAVRRRPCHARYLVGGLPVVVQGSVRRSPGRPAAPGTPGPATSPRLSGTAPAKRRTAPSLKHSPGDASVVHHPRLQQPTT